MSHSFFSLRRGVAAGGVVALLMAGSAVGIASAQTAPAATPTTTAQNRQAGNQAFVDALAKRLNISSTALQTAITQARSDAGLPANGGFGPGGGGPGGAGGRGFGRNLDAAAQVIGLSSAQLRQELSGSTLTNVATAHGKNPADVAAALKNAVHTRIDQEVTAARLTTAEATQQKQQIDQRIDQQMTEVMPQAAARP